MKLFTSENKVFRKMFYLRRMMPVRSVSQSVSQQFRLLYTCNWYRSHIAVGTTVSRKGKNEILTEFWQVKNDVPLPPCRRQRGEEL
jgi:hypothetical protein